jgi:OOP family OmpA-OmpF porin
MGRVVVIAGFVALVALWLYAGLSDSDMPGFRSAKAVERALAAQAAGALRTSGAGWAKVQLNGQSATLSGVARTEGERDAAIAAVRRAGWPAGALQSGPFHTFVYYIFGADAARKLQPGGAVWGGVVEVYDRTQLAAAQAPFVWTATIVEGRQVRITGFAPSETSRAELAKQAASLFPSGVDDQSTVARGAPAGNWTAAVSWGLGSLAKLSEGSELTFSDAAFLIRGVTDNPATPGVIKQRAAQVMSPFRGETDIALVGEQVPPAAPPAPLAISEFTWSARVGPDRRALLTGYAPSPELKAEIAAAALTEFPAGVEDRTLVATAAPEGDWATAAKWALRLLTKLDTGEAAFTANRLMVSGVAARDDIRVLVVNGARQISEPFTGDAVILLPGQDAPVPTLETPAPPETPAPTLEIPALPTPELPAPETAPPEAAAQPTEPQEPEAANRSQAALKCQTLLNAHMANQSIEFDSGRTAIKASSFALLDQIAATALTCPGLQLIVSGHTDNTGNRRTNRALSEARARAVVAYLRNKGVANGRMTARGYGDTRPAAPNDTEDGKARNRRIQITVID